MNDDYDRPLREISGIPATMSRASEVAVSAPQPGPTGSPDGNPQLMRHLFGDDAEEVQALLDRIKQRRAGTQCYDSIHRSLWSSH